MDALAAQLAAAKGPGSALAVVPKTSVGDVRSVADKVIKNVGER